jgi:hypothetical protein
MVEVLVASPHVSYELEPRLTIISPAQTPAAKQTRTTMPRTPNSTSKVAHLRNTAILSLAAIPTGLTHAEQFARVLTDVIWESRATDVTFSAVTTHNAAEARAVALTASLARCRGTFDCAAVSATCKAFGIKHTQDAIAAWLQGHEANDHTAPIKMIESTPA